MEPPFLQIGDLFIRAEAIVAMDFETKGEARLVMSNGHELFFYQDAPEYHVLLQWLTSQARVLLGGRHIPGEKGNP